MCTDDAAVEPLLRCTSRQARARVTGAGRHWHCNSSGNLVSSEFAARPAGRGSAAAAAVTDTDSNSAAVSLLRRDCSALGALGTGPCRLAAQDLDPEYSSYKV